MKQTQLDTAIKAAIEVAQKSAPGTHHTQLLNQVASKLGFKNFRALKASLKNQCAPEKKAESTQKDNQSAFKPLDVICWCHDEMVSTARYTVSKETAGKLLAMVESSKLCEAAITHPSEQQRETSCARNWIDTRLMVHPNGKFEIAAFVYDKHSSIEALTSGWLDLDTLIAAGTGTLSENQHVGADYIWDEINRCLYIIGEAGEDLSCWIDSDEPHMQKLLERYENEEFEDVQRSEHETQNTGEESIESKYLRLGRQKCPYCESSNISGGEVNVDSDSASQEVHCGNCGASWDDVYTFAFANQFEAGE